MKLKTPNDILLVDDDEEAPFFFGRLLRQAAVSGRVIAVCDGREAESFIERAATRRGGIDHPLVTFLNVHMPITGGFEVMRWIREHRSLDRMAIIVCSDSEDPAHVVLSGKLGAQCYITKYPPPADLRRILGDAHSFAAGNPENSALFRVRSNLMIFPFPPRPAVREFPSLFHAGTTAHAAF